MKFIQLITLFSLYILCFFAWGSNAIVVDPRSKTSGAKQTSSSVTQSSSSSSTGGHGGGAVTLGLNKDGEPIDAVAAFEELKTLTSELSRKSALHKHITIGSAVTNAALLLLLTGLIGFGLRERESGAGESGEKEQKKSGESGSGSGSGNGSGGDNPGSF